MIVGKRNEPEAHVFLQAKHLLKHKYIHVHTKRADRDASLAVLF